MSTTTTHSTSAHVQTSKLSSLHLDFEIDRTIAEERKLTKRRTHIN